MKSILKQAYALGVEARNRGVDITKNPYCPVSEQKQRRDWRLGWKAGGK